VVRLDLDLCEKEAMKDGKRGGVVYIAGFTSEQGEWVTARIGANR
jgi:hypothetical protein